MTERDVKTRKSAVNDIPKVGCKKIQSTKEDPCILCVMETKIKIKKIH